MTKEELKNEAEQYSYDVPIYQIEQQLEKIQKAYLAGAEPREKRIEELEAKISVLLSCKNCPENKGGLICAKEYENKCLAKKIQFIKELQEENKVLTQNLEDTEILNNAYEKRFNDLEKENAELRKRVNELETINEKSKQTK